jgi:hypothetical protein
MTSVVGFKTFSSVKIAKFPLFGIEEKLEEFIKNDMKWKKKIESNIGTIESTMIADHENDLKWKSSIDLFKPVWNKSGKTYELAVKNSIERLRCSMFVEPYNVKD